MAGAATPPSSPSGSSIIATHRLAKDIVYPSEKPQEIILRAFAQAAARISGGVAGETEEDRRHARRRSSFFFLTPASVLPFLPGPEAHAQGVS